MGKDSCFNNWYWENYTAICKRMKLDYCLTPYTKVNSKWIKYLNIRHETIKLLEENMSKSLFNISMSCFLLDTFSWARATK